MKHGILITAHDNIPVVKTMFKMLDDSRFTFYLLVDKKSNFSPSDFIPQMNNAKVNILPRININWAGYSQIEAELLLIEAALKDGQEYLHFIQGADLPMKTPDEICNFFDPNKIYMDISKDPEPFANYKVLCKHFFSNLKSFRNNKALKLSNHLIAHAQKPFAKKKKMFGKLYSGSATWSIPANFAEFVLSKKSTIEKEYRHSLAADEVFIHTICKNTEYANQISEFGSARFIDWENKEGNSPKTFLIEDKQRLAKAISDPTVMFARKFSASRDIDIVKFIFSSVGTSVV